MTAVMDRKISSLEARMEAKYNEALQETASTLQDIKDQVAAVCDNQQKMLRAIDSIGKELQ